MSQAWCAFPIHSAIHWAAIHTYSAEAEFPLVLCGRSRRWAKCAFWVIFGAEAELRSVSTVTHRTLTVTLTLTPTWWVQCIGLAGLQWRRRPMRYFVAPHWIHPLALIKSNIIRKTLEVSRIPSRSPCEWTVLSTIPWGRRSEQRAVQTRHGGDCGTGRCTGSLQSHTLCQLTSRCHGNNSCNLPCYTPCLKKLCKIIFVRT